MCVLYIIIFYNFLIFEYLKAKNEKALLKPNAPKTSPPAMGKD